MENKNTPLQTACGGYIEVTDRSLEYMKHDQKVLALLSEAAAKLSLPTEGTELKESVDLGRIIGETDCVPVSIGIPLFFAKRKDKSLCQTPFRVIDKQKPETSKFTVIAVKKGGQWVLKMGWIGEMAPRMPTDQFFKGKLYSQKFREAKRFWDRHALAWDSETMEYPYRSEWRKELA